jgi:putative ABC transport system permease protein
VLYAALASTQDERLYQATVMRTLGAHRRQLNRANLAEFALIGAMAGLMAAAGANALGMVVAQRIINVDYHFSAMVWITGVLGTMAGVMVAGWLGTRRVLRTPPLPVLRELA